MKKILATIFVLLFAASPVFATYLGDPVLMFHGGTGRSTWSVGSIVFAGAGALTQDSGLFWDATNHRMGIGTITPALPLAVVNATAGQPTIEAISTGTLSTTSGPVIGVVQSNGTAMGSGNKIGAFAGFGWDGVTNGGAGGLSFYATQGWTNTAHGSQLVFRTVPNGSTTSANALLLDQNQQVTMGAYGAGISRFSSGGLISSAEISGDCTTSGSNAIVCTQTNGVAFGPLATASTSGSAIQKANGSGGLTAATAGTDYAAATPGTSSQLLASNGAGGFSAVTVGSGLSLSAGTITASGGSPSLSVASKTAAYTILSTDDIVQVSNASTTYAITLPTAVGATGKTYYLVRTDNNFNNPVTISTTSAQTVGGYASGAIGLYTLNEVWELYSDGSNWQIRNHKASSKPFSVTNTYGNFGTVTTSTVMVTREGRYATMTGYFVSDTPTGGNANIALPSGISIDTAAYTSVGNGVELGVANIMQSSSTSITYGSGKDVLFCDGSSATQLWFAEKTATSAFVKDAGSAVTVLGTKVTYSIRFPVANWSE